MKERLKETPFFISGHREHRLRDERQQAVHPFLQVTML
jgi:hypothetical protein